MRSGFGLYILIGLMILLDFYVFQVVKLVANGTTEKTKMVVYGVYWTISVLVLVLLIGLPYLQFENWPRSARTYVFSIVLGWFFAKLIASLFFLVDDARRGVMWIIGKILPNAGAQFTTTGGIISRSAFLSWLGLGMGGGLFGTLLYGFTNKYNYKVRRLSLRYPNLPQSFSGLKIVQISDIHSGSFTDRQAVAMGIRKIMDEQPDLILFTGDLVNDRAEEMKDYVEVFSKLHAPLGVFSTLGNHDYGDYVQWPSPEAKTQNLEELKQVHAKMGWRLLMNEHVPLEKNGEAIALIGIENWGAKARFPKYGRLAEAYAGTGQFPFKILLSHDPSHWDAQVRPQYNDIDLTLSGHTHGMQFGIENPYFRWSPVQWVYKQWAGLYQEGAQKLYVNRGFGFIGYPGRVGILPEISVITLEREV